VCKLNRAEALDVSATFRDLENLTLTGVFTNNQLRPDDPCFRALITQSLIDLEQILKLLQKDGFRLTSTDDLEFNCTDKHTEDLSSLIYVCRNAAVHFMSTHRVRIEQVRAPFNVQVGRGSVVNLFGTELNCPYEDDTAVFWGPQRLLLQRNLIRAINDTRPHIYEMAKHHGFKYDAG